MSSAIAQIRSIVQDQPVMVVESLVLDGAQTWVRTTYYPLIATSVVISPTLTPTIDEQSGLLSWSSAPAAGTYSIRYTFVMLLDQTIQDLLDIQNSDGSMSSAAADVTRLCAANALDAMATLSVIIQKKIDLLDLKTDGSAVSKEMREHADVLRQQVSNPDYYEKAFDIIEEINDTAGYKEKVIKDFLREDC